MKRFLIFLPANSQNRLGMDKALMGNSLMQTLKQVGKREDVSYFQVMCGKESQLLRSVFT